MRTSTAVFLTVALIAAAAACGQQAGSAPAATETPAEVAPMDEAGRAGQASPGSGQEAPASSPQRRQDQGAGLGPNTLWVVAMLGGLFLLWFWMSRGPSKERKRREEMLGALKKGDKVTTIGGIVGTVIEVRSDEVVIKVDESANVRMKFARWAIRGVGEAGKAEQPERAEKEKAKE